jgi:MoxR-like ATPase
MSTTIEAGQVTRLANAIVAEVEKAIVGKRQTVVQSVLTLLANGHLLIEDIPGVGKTTLAKALCRSMGGTFHRVQFTPDLLPADVTGSAIYNQRDLTFDFRPGPVFGNVLLVDEINRATPKTQSALLEAMEERQVTSDGVTRRLPEPFFVIATQNNLEMTGTYPLPEAQLDRFFARVALGYPDRDDETAILTRQQTAQPLDSVGQVCSLEEMRAAQAAVRRVFVHDHVRQYIVDVVRATRGHGLLVIGASPRGSLYLMTGAQAQAAIHGYERVTPDHVKAVAPIILGHRVIARGEVLARGTTHERVIQDVLDQVPVPYPLA